MGVGAEFGWRGWGHHVSASLLKRARNLTTGDEVGLPPLVVPPPATAVPIRRTGTLVHRKKHHPPAARANRLSRIRSGYPAAGTADSSAADRPGTEARPLQQRNPRGEAAGVPPPQRYPPAGKNTGVWLQGAPHPSRSVPYNTRCSARVQKALQHAHQALQHALLSASAESTPTRAPGPTTRAAQRECRKHSNARTKHQGVPHPSRRIPLLRHPPTGPPQPQN
ncbi:hypothetical protein NDU88_004200 [Pleurodeles waltl]|uniref:Uncharacterized protein n=1 Tax=Pleurodeles waltl TaxID=8319 RepID=A0AAV7SI37_PLEWA|nr:hypothetical protein NDU88_004200 [Pleurodeles waltl]